MSATFEFEAIGTHWKIDLFDGAAEKNLFPAVRKTIDAFEQTYSRFMEDSLVSRMSRVPETYTLPAEARPLFDLYQELYRTTDGAVTPLIGQTLVEAGYDPAYTLRSRTLHRPPAWEEALDYDFPTLTIKIPCQLDFGAAGKGFLIDRVSELLTDSGQLTFCVNAGGDIYYKNPGASPLKIGLEDPRDTTRVIGVADVLNQSICGSAGSRRAWGNFHHLIDPRTLESPKKVLAVWTVADSALLADGLSTALFFVPPARLACWKFEYAVLHEDSTVEASPAFPAEFYLA